ncbi:MAG: hypothetical protein KatS3mg001_568 [Candidatus Pacearchaeota archaeon]|nr:MAG: hypothetical protein KatS3mg001_568 [Candidatus Pacearchaeota archaeon]
MNKIKKTDTSKKSLLYETSQLDCLSYYKNIFPKLKNFLKNREIATKIYLENYPLKFLVKRGSKDEPLFIDELKISKKFLELRKAKDLNDVKEKLSQQEIKIWHYFVPRKMIEFHYACNHEKGEEIDRIFIDIDRSGKYTAEDSKKVTLELINQIRKDSELKKIINFEIKIVWTGKSFHVYLFLKKKVNHKFYDLYFSWGKDKESFIEKWAEEISKKTNIPVEAHHERERGKIILDTSATPPGKLARSPFSLHLNSNGEIDGISVPLSIKQLKDKNIIQKLQKLNVEEVIKNLNKYKI